MYKVLIADKMDAVCAEILKARGVQVESKPGLTPEEFAGCIGDYDALAVRSSAKVTADIIAHAKKLRVIGRAGIGVDTIDVPAATAAGMIVMNTPFGNSVTTAEHTIALIMALARQIPQANTSTHAGKWEKTKFMGMELMGKTLGMIGCGNIGAIVANRALGLQMKVVAYDPFLTAQRAAEMGVEKAELDDMLARADVLTIHTPATDKTKGMVNAVLLAKLKKGAKFINCARGELMVEADVKAALDSGQLSGAALDVFTKEPATENVLFNHPNVICTPHLGASTTEAQVNVAVQIAEQIADYLLSGAVTNAVNTPSISAEDAPKLKPYLKLAEGLGKFAGSMVEQAPIGIEIAYLGGAAHVNTKPLTAVMLANLLASSLDGVNMVNAPEMAKSRGIDVSESKSDNAGDLHTAMRVQVKTRQGMTTLTGTLFGGSEVRIVDIDGVPIEAAITPHMLLIRNQDKPGLIGSVGTLLGNAGVNIADFRLGRVGQGNRAIAMVSVDSVVTDALLRQLQALPQAESVQRLAF